MNIKQWSERVMPKDGYVQTVRTTQLKNMQTEIDELRAALQERDAWVEKAVDRIEEQRKVLEQAEKALDTCRIRSVSEWEVREVTPKIITEAITAIQEQLA